MRRKKGRKARRRGRAVTVRLSDVEVKAVRWLWPGYLPLGKLTLLDGDPDKGKSLLTLDLASRVTTGAQFPDGAACQSGGVVILSAEDDLEDTIRPRLDAARADPSRVVCLAGVRVARGQVASASLSDLDALEQAVRLVRAKLVIVDTLTDFFGSGSLLNPQAVRAVLLPLIALAKKLDFAVILIRHFTKTGKTIMTRGAGSTAIAAVARSGLFVVKDPDDATRRVLGCYKHNVSPREPDALAFRFVSEKGAGRVSWEPPTRWTAEALFAASLESQKAKSARQQAREFLQESLESGPQPANQLIDAGKAQGIALRTLQRARRELAIRCERRGGSAGTWYLRLVQPALDGGTPPARVGHELSSVLNASDNAEVKDSEAGAGPERKDRQSDSGALERSYPPPPTHPPDSPSPP